VRGVHAAQTNKYRYCLSIAYNRLSGFKSKHVRPTNKRVVSWETI